MPLTIALRADVSSKIGTGHLMRCLTLANQLKARGCECVFVSRNFDHDWLHRVEHDGFPVKALPYNADLGDPYWGYASEAMDAEESLLMLRDVALDWMIVDHYDLGSKWERTVRESHPGVKLLAIDDLANREHSVDVLVDVTYGRTADDYRKWVDRETACFVGSEFALLRDAFQALREHALVRRQSASAPWRVLVSLGGSNVNGPLEIIVNALEILTQSHEFSVKLIANEPAESVIQRFLNLPVETEHENFSNDMAAEFLNADVSIGSAGGTTWERCCLGLPSVVVKLADNQNDILANLDAIGAFSVADLDAQDIAKKVEALITHSEAYSKMVTASAAICDGSGTSRIINEVFAQSIDCKTAVLDDARFIYDARYSDRAHRFYRSQNLPSFEDHCAWLETHLPDADKEFLCVELAGEKVAHIRMDFFDNEKTAGEIGISLAPGWRGKRIGTPVLIATSSYFASKGVTYIDAEVHSDNTASIRIFEKAGYDYLKTDENGYRQYRLTIT